MAQPQEANTGEKRRGPGRPKSATPAPKRQRTSIAAPATPAIGSPAYNSPAIGSPAPDKKTLRIPKLADSKPLPSLPVAQSASLSDEDYHSIAASGVLAASLERSRLNWVSNGLFKRYWTKPESGKNAKPPPPGNPDVKCMKSKGECRIRIEPHIFEAEVFVEERPKQPAPPKQYAATATSSAFGVAHRPSQNMPSQAPRPPPMNGQTPVQSIPRANTPIQPQSQQQRAQQVVTTPAPQQEKKADPVISMLASRASSDAELKALMKEVATGKATPEQLKIFQRHIDELTIIIQKQKSDDDHEMNNLAHANAIQYEGTTDVKSQPAPQLTQPPQSRPPYPTAQAPPPYHQQQPAWTTPPPAPTTFPVIIGFSHKMPGATEDRFLFPQHSVLEALSAQHLLVSFMIIRHGRDAADPTGLDPDKEYWQPVTMMVEVAYGREEILNCIRRWVKPLAEVQKHMEETMKRCTRAPETHLAMRLPAKGVVPESEETSKEPTPLIEEKPKPKAKTSVKYVKTARPPAKAATPGSSKKAAAEATSDQSKAAGDATPKLTSAATPKPAEKTEGSSTPATDAPTDATGPSENGRPRRAVRKSVRISEG